LKGFHPLYRALIDSVPDGTQLNAWDNVKLHQKLSTDSPIREEFLRLANVAKRKPRHPGTGAIANAYHKYYWPPNQALTALLPGDIELHHTAPFPTFERPFVLHCESFAPIFIPFARQGGGELANYTEVRKHYHTIFAHPLCLGVFSHVPETLISLNRFFSDPVVAGKLFSSRIGLPAIADRHVAEKPPLSRPRFLFLNSAHQNPDNFFRRGGHIALRFWAEFLAAGRDGVLILRCGRPPLEDLASHGVDTSFLQREIGRSIIWAQDYLADHEMNALMANAHFLLLPSMSLHSASIMQAMSSGTIPVVTDTVGTSIYVDDDEHGIVLRGMRSAIWHEDPETGVPMDRYSSTPHLDESLVAQLMRRIVALLDAPQAYHAMRERAATRARELFSGAAFSSEFWNSVADLRRGHQSSLPGIPPESVPLRDKLRDCTLQGDDWTRVFESPSQPMPRIYTGKSTVSEIGGAMVHADGSPDMELNDWSVVAQYWSFGAPRLTFANTIEELRGVHLAYAGAGGLGPIRKLTRFIGKLLMPYPAIYSFAASVLKKSRRCHRFFMLCFIKIAAMAPRSRQAVAEQSPQLALEGFYGFNIIRSGDEFYGILQSEGAFTLEKIRSRQYSRAFHGQSLAEVQTAIIVSLDAELDTDTNKARPLQDLQKH
jgi:hypothetical protein